MRIGYITLSCAHNYGAVLQAYALGYFLNEHGYEAELIDYVTERYQIDNPDFVFKSTVRWRKNIGTRFLWKITKHRNEIKCRECFNKFVNQYIPKTKTYISNEDLKQHLPLFDLFISGSDQIWNTDFSWDSKPDLPYFLDFVPESIPKIAYSSSFGKARLKDDEQDEIKHLLSKYSAIAVREYTGKDIVEKLGLQAKVVVDPTLLCNRKVWDELASKKIINRPYILLFQIFPNDELKKTAKRIAKKKGMKLVIVSANPMHRKKLGMKAIFLTKVENWLSYIKYANYVLTDSFHGSVFSILFNRQFVSNINVMGTSRITGLLDSLNLTDRKTKDLSFDSIWEIIEKDIDYSETNACVEKMRMDSANWLLSVIEEQKYND